MKKEFLELGTLLMETQALSEGLSILIINKISPIQTPETMNGNNTVVPKILVLEKVDSLYANSRQAMCARYKIGNGAFSRV